MKRIFSTILAALMLLSCMGVAALAEGEGLTIISATAPNGAQSTPVSALLTYTFSEDIAEITKEDVSLVVKDTPTELVSEVLVSGNTLKVRANSKLAYNTTYSLDLTKVSAKADADKKLPEEAIVFTTKQGNSYTMFEDDFEAGVKDAAVWRSESDGLTKMDDGNYAYKMTATKELSNYLTGYSHAYELYGEMLFGFDFYIDKSTLLNSANADINYYFFSLAGNDGSSKASFESKRLLGYDKKNDILGITIDTTDSNASMPTNLTVGLPVNDKSWNKILVKLNSDQKTYSLYVNGALVKDNTGKSNFSFACTSTSKPITEECPVTNVKFQNLADSNHSGGTGAVIYFDNFYYRKAVIAAPDSTVMTLASSAPSFDKAVKDTQKEFVLTYNHEISASSVGTVTINDTPVKSAVVSGNTVTVTIPDNYKLKEDTEYTFDFVGAEDVYGCMIPSATFRTKVNYNMYKMDFNDGLAENDEYWYMRYVTDEDELHEGTVMEVVDDAEKEGNKFFRYKMVGSDQIRLQSRRGTDSSKPELDIVANEVVTSFSLKLTGEPTWKSPSNHFIPFYSVFYYDYSTGSAVSKSFENIFRLQDNEEGYEVLCKEYKSSSSDTYTKTNQSFKYGDWLNIKIEFNFEKEEYYVGLNNEVCGPYKMIGRGLKGIDTLLFAASSNYETDCEFYLDDIMVGQKFFADTDYDMGFYNSEGVKTNVVDPIKTTYKVTAVNRGASNDDTKLILVVTDTAENRMTDIRLIDFAEKNEKDEIVIEVPFENIGFGKKIKAFYWDGFGSLTPVLGETRFVAEEAAAVSAN